MQPKELALVMRTQLRAGKQGFKHKFSVIMLKRIQAWPRFNVSKLPIIWCSFLKMLSFIIEMIVVVVV